MILCGDIMLKMTAVGCLEFWKFAFYVRWPLSPCYSALPWKISTKSDNRLPSYCQKWFSTWRPSAISNFIYFHLMVSDCHKFEICYSIPNFIKIAWFLAEIWRFNNFRNGGRPPSWIFEILSLCHVSSIAMLFCFPMQNFTEIRQTAAELWSNNEF